MKPVDNPIIVNNQPFVDFFETDEGHNLWDSIEIRIIYDKQVVFVLESNFVVALDVLKFIDLDTNGSTENVNNYIVTGYATFDEVNYVFIMNRKD